MAKMRQIGQIWEETELNSGGLHLYTWFARTEEKYWMHGTIEMHETEYEVVGSDPIEILFEKKICPDGIIEGDEVFEFSLSAFMSDSTIYEQYGTFIKIIKD